MAVYRPPQHCLFCGKELIARYRDQSHLPPSMRLIGDTFEGYEPCKCKGKGKKSPLKKLRDLTKMFIPSSAKSESDKYGKKEQALVKWLASCIFPQSFAEGVEKHGKQTVLNCIDLKLVRKSWSNVTSIDQAPQETSSSSNSQYIELTKEGWEKYTIIS